VAHGDHQRDADDAVEGLTHDEIERVGRDLVPAGRLQREDAERDQTDGGGEHDPVEVAEVEHLEDPGALWGEGE
jgi:hypothetical protein